MYSVKSALKFLQVEAQNDTQNDNQDARDNEYMENYVEYQNSSQNSQSSLVCIIRLFTNTLSTSEKKSVSSSVLPGM